jgi:hypothetical protein
MGLKGFKSRVSKIKNVHYANAVAIQNLPTTILDTRFLGRDTASEILCTSEHFALAVSLQLSQDLRKHQSFYEKSSLWN